jgi:hypothetical protein
MFTCLYVQTFVFSPGLTVDTVVKATDNWSLTEKQALFDHLQATLKN